MKRIPATGKRPKQYVISSVPIVRENVIDRDDDMFTDEILKNMDDTRVPIFRDFNYEKQIGIGILHYRDGIGLNAELKINKDERIGGLIPCLGFKAECRKKTKDHYEYSGKCEAIAIGLCKKNSDIGIPAIK